MDKRISIDEIKKMVEYASKGEKNLTEILRQVAKEVDINEYAFFVYKPYIPDTKKETEGLCISVVKGKGAEPIILLAGKLGVIYFNYQEDKKRILIKEKTFKKTDHIIANYLYEILKEKGVVLPQKEQKEQN